jgi:glycosyltransferase involved in cell wall biosynthesis
VYLRQSTVSPSLVALARTTPTVVELNTLDLAELRLRSRWRYWYARLARDTLLRAARGIVAVSQPIAEDADVTRLRLPTVVVPNGIDLDLHQPLPPASGPYPRLVFVGTPGAPWHGVDKIARLARIEPSWVIDVVGPDRDALIPRPPNVRMHGLLPSEKVLPILATADAAIGPLAFHRLGLISASPLKVAEYLAHGIPTIIAYHDERFPDGGDFLLEIPNAEDNVDSSINEIRAFVRAWMGRRVNRSAVAAIDVRHIEERRLTFLRGVVAGQAPAAAGA